MLSAIAARKAAAANAPPSLLPSPTSSPPLIAPIGDKPPHVLSKPRTQPQAVKTTEATSGRSTPKKTKKNKRALEESEDSTQRRPARHRPNRPAEVSNLAGPSTPSRRRPYSPSRPLDAVENDSDEGMLGIDVEPEHEVVRGWQGTKLSTFYPSSGVNWFLSDRDSAYLILHPQESLCFIGTTQLQVVRGSINLLGVTLSTSPTVHPVFAPRSHPLPVITAVSHPGNPIGTDLPNEIIKHCGPSDSVILLRVHRTGVEGLGEVCRIFENIFHGPKATPSLECMLEGFHPVYDTSSVLQPFSMQDSWDEAIKDIMISSNKPNILSPPIALVKGIKKSGKSTFAKTLLNRLCSQYKHVAFLECDLGQPEFAPGGLVSLHLVSQPILGPSFTHPTQAYSAHYVGASTPRSSPSYYLAAISALIETYKMDLQYATAECINQNSSMDQVDGEEKEANMIPLVINTQGWTKGMGADLLSKIEEIVEPTNIFAFEQDNERWGSLAMNGPDSTPGRGSNKWFNPNPVWASSATTQAKVYTLSLFPPSPLLNLFSASDLRAINILSYFFASSSTSLNTSWNTSSPLVAQVPYEVDPAQALDAIVLASTGSEDVVSEEVVTALTCSLVGLVEADDNTFFASEFPPGDGLSDTLGNTLPYKRGCLPPDPTNSRCLGLGLIRGISTSESGVQFHVLTPVVPTLLARARVIVKGDIDLPIWGYLDHRPDVGNIKEGDAIERICGLPWESTPYLQFNATGRGSIIGGAVKRARRNLMRKGQM